MGFSMKLDDEEKGSKSSFKDCVNDEGILMRQRSADSADTASMCVEGILFCRRGRATRNSALNAWKRRFVSLSFQDSGSVTIFRISSRVNQQTTLINSVYSGMQRSISVNDGSPLRSVTAQIDKTHGSRSTSTTVTSKSLRIYRNLDTSSLKNSAPTIDLHFPANLPWIVKDIANDSANFLIEIEIVDNKESGAIGSDNDEYDEEFSSPVKIEYTDSVIPGHQEPATPLFPDDNSMIDGIYEGDEDECDDDECSREKKAENSLVAVSSITPIETSDLLNNIASAHRKGKPFRLYFCCNHGRHEKSLWLQAFSKLGRLSVEVERKKSLFSNFLVSPFAVTSRPRAAISQALARDVRQLELNDECRGTVSAPSLSTSDHDALCQISNSNVEIARGMDTVIVKDKEYRVQPTYVYPHRWMTRREMKEEMLLPSETIHNLRHPDCAKKQIGSISVEILQCLGLPKLDRTRLIDAIVYLVLGEYAFATDAIPNRANPMWLRKARRACTFPIFHAFARLYVGVFDDDKRSIKDEFAGRVVIDLARLRPRSTYDVTLPLRLSTHVYSRRRRGSIRLRFSLEWKSERDALFSYLPKRVRIPLPQNTRPNMGVTVLCTDQKAFRNIAITVHGSNLPGKFTFQQMRAAIREINFTRKYIFTAIRTWIRETRHWYHPVTSGVIFCAWMHCIYANQFSLVPAYVILFFVFQLMRTYAKYGIDADCHQGFIPPSWEELMNALLRGSDEDFRSIEELEFGLRPLLLRRHRSPQSMAASTDTSFNKNEYFIKTHQPKGKSLFKALGFLGGVDYAPFATDDVLEFPFSNSDYPRFTVKESLATKHKDDNEPTKDFENDNPSTDCTVDGLSMNSWSQNRSGTMRHLSAAFDMVEMPDILRHMELPDIQSIMRKDSSGLWEFDEEESNFAARHAVVHSGKLAASTLARTGRLAASTVTSTVSGIATEVTEKSGLHHVVSPMSRTIHRRGSSLGRGIHRSGSSLGKSIHTGITTSVNLVQGPVSTSSNSLCRSNDMELEPGSSRRRSNTGDSADGRSCDELFASLALEGVQSLDHAIDGEEETDPFFVFPQQNVDVEGPSTGKKLTEDLSEIKEKIHEMTWNLFNDKVYHVKHKDTVFFGQSNKKSKNREVSKSLDKLLKVKQYSHPNPFVARMGLYVEPIIGSIYCFLLPCRAGFNLLIWRDPMLTFWVSVICGILGLILFIFPWRLFLFCLGVLLVGPQNWIIRILREKGHLPPLPPRKLFLKKKDELIEDPSTFPVDQPVFTAAHREPGNTFPEQSFAANDSSLDPREIHRVVVPYTPLMYQRFYDWPPEPQYAKVTPVGIVESPKSRTRKLSINGSSLLSLRSIRSDLTSSFTGGGGGVGGGSQLSMWRRIGSSASSTSSDLRSRSRIASTERFLLPRSQRTRSRCQSMGDAPRSRNFSEDSRKDR